MPFLKCGASKQLRMSDIRRFSESSGELTKDLSANIRKSSLRCGSVVSSGVNTECKGQASTNLENPYNEDISASPLPSLKYPKCGFYPPIYAATNYETAKIFH